MKESKAKQAKQIASEMVQFMWLEFGTNTKMHLPDDVVFDILSRLPVKTLQRFRCVCKYWNSLIQEPAFINFHLKKSGETLVRYFCSVTFVRTVDLTVESMSMFYSFHEKNLTVFSQRNSNFSLNVYDTIASCNGLLCTGGPVYGKNSIQDGSRSYRLQVQNPALHETLSLPIVPDYVWRSPVITMIGIGFDSVLKKYKVVFWDLESGSEAMIITLGENSWRIINDCPIDNLNILPSRATVYLRGASHWCTSAGILSFHFTQERFSLVPFPAGIISDYTLWQIYVMEDQVCLVDERKDVAVLNMWLLVDYNKQEWVCKQIHLQCRNYVGEVVPIREGEVLIDMDGTWRANVYHCRYDKEGHIINSTKLLEIPNANNEQFRRRRCVLCAQSLVSLKQIDGTCEVSEQSEDRRKTVPFWRKCGQLKFY